MSLKLKNASDMLSVLGHPGRLSVLRLLARRAPGEVRAGEIAEILDLRPNTLSVYVSALEGAGFVVSQRHGRSIGYSLLPSRMSELTEYLTEDCLCGRSVPAQRPDHWDVLPAVANVLFLSKHNDSRSLIAEALLNSDATGRFRAFSAGVNPAREASAPALKLLSENGLDVSELHTKDCANFRSDHAKKMDVVVTLCHEMANEDEPHWPGNPLRVYWSTDVPGDENQIDDADPMAELREIYDLLSERISAFTQLPFQRLDRLALQARIDALATLSVPPSGATAQSVMKVL